MAEIQAASLSDKKGSSRKNKKLSTKVDLTPMVDLGFLLITFFIFTTTLGSPTVMKLVMPDDKPGVTETNVSEDKTLTLLLLDHDRIFYYPGKFNGEAREINYKQLRNLIITKKKELLNRFHSSNMTILIKVSDRAIFKNVVDSLDEMLINTVSSYMILEPGAKELEAVK